MKKRRTVQLVVLVLAATAFLGSGCQSIRKDADRGTRIREMPGIGPAKVLAMIGAAPGYAVGVPVMILLLPTLPFQKTPGFTYPSSPQHDIPMPILYAPLSYSSGIGSLAFASPCLAFQPMLGSPAAPTDWPPLRDWRGEGEKSPGQIVWTETAEAGR